MNRQAGSLLAHHGTAPTIVDTDLACVNARIGAGVGKEDGSGNDREGNEAGSHTGVSVAPLYAEMSGPPEAAGDHAIGIAQSSGVDAVGKSNAVENGVDVLPRPAQVNVAGFAFDTEHEITAMLLPVVADSAASNEAAAKAVTCVSKRFGPL